MPKQTGGGGVYLDGGRELEIVRQHNPFLGNLLHRIFDGLTKLAQNASIGSFGELAAPPPVNSTTVKGTYVASTNTLTAPGEILHWTHTHNAQLQRGIQYITEISNDPSFINAHPLDKGASRSGFVHLPALDDSGQPVAYYLRAIAQNHGSAPSEPVVFGGANNPTRILMTGTTQMSLLPTQGGGTARPGQTGKGLGDVLFRPPNGSPKRQLT